MWGKYNEHCMHGEHNHKSFVSANEYGHFSTDEIAGDSTIYLFLIKVRGKNHDSSQKNHTFTSLRPSDAYMRQ